MLAEHEVLDRLKSELRTAIDDCDKLAKLPARGPTYMRFRHSIKVIEGHCRVMAYYREDSRWFRVGLAMAEAHKRAGNWLRRHQRTVNSNPAHPLFLKLGENLRALLRQCERLETMATYRIGMILPEPQPLPHHRPRLVGQVMLPSGLVVPGGAVH